jgi:hypothetical protein
MLGMMGDRKKAVADIVLMLGSKKNGEGKQEREESNEDEGRGDNEQMMIIAEDMLDAFESKSASKLASALSAFASCCGMESEDMEEE